MAKKDSILLDVAQTQALLDETHEKRRGAVARIKEIDAFLADPPLMGDPDELMAAIDDMDHERERLQRTLSLYDARANALGQSLRAKQLAEREAKVKALRPKEREALRKVALAYAQFNKALVELGAVQKEISQNSGSVNRDIVPTDLRNEIWYSCEKIRSRLPEDLRDLIPPTSEMLNTWR